MSAVAPCPGALGQLPPQSLTQWGPGSSGCHSLTGSGLKSLAVPAPQLPLHHQQCQENKLLALPLAAGQGDKGAEGWLQPCPGPGGAL